MFAPIFPEQFVTCREVKIRKKPNTYGFENVLQINVLKIFLTV